MNWMGCTAKLLEVDPMYKYSCSDYTFPLLNRSQSLQLLRLLGFDFVDIGLFARSSTYTPAEMCASPKNLAADVRRELQNNALQIADLFLQVGVHPAEKAVNDPNATVRAESREVFLRAVELCQSLHGEHITGLPGVRQSEQSAERDWELAVYESAWRVEQCAKAGIQYAIEPHLGSICESVSSTLSFLEDVPGLSLTLDYGHFIYQGIETEQVHPLLPHASHLHARGGARGRLQTAVSENAIRFDSIMENLTALHYAGHIALEYVWVDWEGCNRVDNVAETILLRDLLQQLSSV